MREHPRAYRSTGAAHRPSLASQGAHAMKPSGANAFPRLKIFCLGVSVFLPLSACRNGVLYALDLSFEVSHHEP